MIALTVCTLAFAFGFAPGGVPSSVRIAVGLPFVLFAPGYALVSVLFPNRSSADRNGIVGIDRDDPGVTVVERLVLSIGLSAAVVPLVGVVLTYAPGGTSRASVLGSLSALVIALSIAAAVRRLGASPESRFRPRIGRPLVGGWKAVRATDTRSEYVLNVLLVVGLLVAASGVVYAVAAPDDGETYTEFYVLTEDNETGDLVADGYPTELPEDGSETLYVGITNEEAEPVTYTVVVELQRVESRGGDPVVAERTELHRFRPTVAPSETWTREHDVASTIDGDRLRLAYYLYVDDPPSSPDSDTAYRHLHVWTTESAGAEDAEQSDSGAEDDEQSDPGAEESRSTAPTETEGTYEERGSGCELTGAGEDGDDGPCVDETNRTAGQDPESTTGNASNGTAEDATAGEDDGGGVNDPDEESDEDEK